jgi:hypothetical protein
MNSKRTRASFMRDHALAYAREEFKGTSGFNVIEKRGLIVLAVGNAVGLVFRKTDKRQRVGPIRTQQQMDFLLHQPIAGIPSGLVRIHASYELNDTETSIVRVILCLMHGRKSVLTIEADYKPKSNVVPFVPQSQPVKPPQMQKRVQPRQPGTGKGKGESESQS